MSLRPVIRPAVSLAQNDQVYGCTNKDRTRQVCPEPAYATATPPAKALAAVKLAPEPAQLAQQQQLAPTAKAGNHVITLPSYWSVDVPAVDMTACRGGSYAHALHGVTIDTSSDPKVITFRTRVPGQHIYIDAEPIHVTGQSRFVVNNEFEFEPNTVHMAPVPVLDERLEPIVEQAPHQLSNSAQQKSGLVAPKTAAAPKS